MKFIPGFLKRKPKLDPTLPETLAQEQHEAQAKKPGFLKNLKDKVWKQKPADAPADKAEDVPYLESLKQKLDGLLDSKNRSHTANTILVITGASAAVAGIAADIAFLGGVGTVTVISCLYSDFRNGKQIQKISGEISKIEQKIDSLRGTQQPAPDYAPALNAVKSSIEDFQASAQKVPPQVAEDLAKLKDQVTALQGKIAPANDDKAAAPKAASGPTP